MSRTLDTIQSLYFIGGGGIGMSALVRYFLAQGKRVAAYDKTATPLTKALEAEGALFHYEENIELIPHWCSDPRETLVVITPAIPADHKEKQWFEAQGFEIQKRAKVLGEITRVSRGICIAGTHGKTTTSSITAHLLHQSHVDCSAFLGGVLKNYESNLLLSATSDLTVIEADEYDRSFHTLTPYMAAITSTDPDHLDIYGTAEAYRESFAHFTSLVRPDGVLIHRYGITLTPRLTDGARCYTYGSEGVSDFFATNIRTGNGELTFDWHGLEDETISNLSLGVPLMINVENATVAIALARLNGVTHEEIRAAIASFQGPRRRFDFWLSTPRMVMIDDYAHHPEELRSAIASVKALYAGRKVTGIFQPHLYSRTNDFAPEFAAALSLLDRVILLPIYPARELPMPGVSSEMLLPMITTPDRCVAPKETLIETLMTNPNEIVLVMGAGDIDALLPQIKQALQTL